MQLPSLALADPVCGFAVPTFPRLRPDRVILASMEAGLSSHVRRRFPGWDDLAQMYEQALPPDSSTSGPDGPHHLDAAAPSGPASEQLIPTIPLDAMPTRAGGPGKRPFDNSAFDVAFETILALCRDGHEQAGADPTIPRLAEFFLNQNKKLYLSKESLGQMLHIDPVRIEPNLSLLSSTLLHCDRLRRQNLEGMLSSSALECLLYIDFAKYDETPMQLSMSHLVNVSRAPAASTTNPSDTGPITDVLGSSQQQAVSSVKMRMSTKAKIFATDQRFGMLLKVPQHLQEAFQQPHVFVYGHSLSLLQVLERTTAGLTKQALQIARSVSSSADLFPMKTRLCTSDAAPSNNLAEKLLASELGPSWSLVHLHCNVHKIAAVHSHSFAQVQQHIQGVVNFALALQEASAMMAFRRALSEVVQEKLTIRIGYPSAECVAYRKFLINLFLSTGRQQCLRRFLLETLPNGNWRNESEVEVFVAPGVDFDRQQLAEGVTKGLLLALSSKVFTTYNQSKWLGCDLALDEVGLCLAVHGLARAAFSRSLQRRQRQAAAAEIAPASGAGRATRQPADSNLELGNPPTGLSRVDADETSQNQTVGALAPGVDQPASDPSTMTSQMWQALSTQRQRVAQQWLHTDPLAHVMLLRLCLGPVATLLRSYIARSGDQWLQKTRAEQVSPGGLEGRKRQRLPPLLEFAYLTSEKVFFDQLRKLCLDDSWLHFPPSSCKQSFLALAFRLLSKIRALVHQHLVAETRKYPMKIFRILQDDTAADEVMAGRPCVRDPFTAKYVEQFGEQGCASPDAKAVLNAVALMASPDTVSVEWGHSKVHRVLNSVAQAQKPTMEYLNAHIVCMQHASRRLVAQGAGLAGKSKCALAALSDSGLQQRPLKVAKKPAGGGGAWRAWCSEHRRGKAGGGDLARLGREYREAKRNRTPAYLAAVQRGRAATARRKAEGVRAFGPKTQEARKRQSKLQLAAPVTQDEALLPASSLRISQEGKQEGPVLSFGLDRRVSQLKRDAMVAGKNRADEHRRQLQCWQSYQERQAEPLRQTLGEGLGLSSRLVQCMHPVPGPDMLVSEVVLEHSTEAVTIAEWASSHASRSNAKASLLKDFENKSFALHDTDGGDEQARIKGEKLCLKYGLCICQEPGLSIFRLRNRMLQLLKDLAPTGNSQTPGKSYARAT